MKKSYEKTFDETMHSFMRMAEVSGSVTRMRIAGFLCAVLAAVLVFFVLSSDAKTRAVFAVMTGAVLGVVLPISAKRIVRRAVTKFAKQEHGSSEMVSCELELNEDRLVFRKGGNETGFAWSNVGPVVENSSDIEITLKPGGLAVIPKRIFENADEVSAFMQAIEEHRRSVDMQVKPV